MHNDFLVDAADRFLREMQAVLSSSASESVGTAEAAAASKRLIAQLRTFERQALRLCGDAETVTGASYLLCTLADELLKRKLGLSWAVESLLVYHHADAHGGQRCWALLDELLAAGAARRHAHRKALLALYDLAIALGMRGVHDLQPGGDQDLHALRARLLAELDNDAEPARLRAELKTLATRHAKRRRYWLRPLLAAAVFLSVATLHWITQQRLEAQWQEAARDAERATAPAFDRQQGGNP